MTSTEQNEPTTMETYLEAMQHNRGSEGTKTTSKLDFAVQFTPTFGYVSDVESAERVRRRYEQITRSKFSTYRQSKDFGKEGIRTEHHKICWEDTCKLNQGRIAFDHLPYIVIGTKMLDCQFGRDRHKAKKKRLRESINNQSMNGDDETKRRKQIAGKKKDCPAQICYRDILKFPDYAISANTVWRRKATSEKLRKAFEREEVKTDRRIYIKFPERDEHKGHEVELVEEELQQASDKVLDKIESLISEGITEVPDTQKRLEDSVIADSTPRKNKPTSPSELEIQNHFRDSAIKDPNSDNIQLTLDTVVSTSSVVVSTQPALVPTQSSAISTPPTVVSAQLPVVSTQPSIIPSPNVIVPTPPSVLPTPPMVVPIQFHVVSTLPSVIPTSPSVVSTPSSVLPTPSFTVPTPSTVVSTHSAVVPTQSAKDTQKKCQTPLDDQAVKCREVLQQLTFDTYFVTDVTVLELLCQQLTEIKQNLEKVKQKENIQELDGYPTECTDDGSCCGGNTSCVLNQSGNTSKTRKLRNRKGLNNSKRQAPRRNKSSSSGNEEEKRLPAPVHAELTSEKPLSESTVQLAQALILEKFPGVHGFEDTRFGRHLLFSMAQGAFGQLMHDGEYHWVFVSSIGCSSGTVRYYDSIGTGKIPDIVRKQIAGILCSQDPEITVDIRPVQMSNSIADSGLFALAYAVSLLHSEDPSEASYDVSLMRQHLYQSLQDKTITTFPKANGTVQRTVQRSVSVEVFCCCRMPWNANPQDSRMKMARCDTCGEWWHSNCCGIPDNVFSRGQSWKCPRCEDVHSAVAALNSLQAAVFPDGQVLETTTNA